MVPPGEENTHGDAPCSIGRQRVMSGTRDGSARERDELDQDGNGEH